MSAAVISVVGIGADGWAGLPGRSRAALAAADVVIGSPRQLAGLDDAVAARRMTLPTPLLPGLADRLAALEGRVAVLGSGDPMFFGIGSTLLRLGVAIEVHPAPSSVSLACARLGWAVQDVEIVSAVGRPLDTLHPALLPGRRVLVLIGSSDAADAVRAMVASRGFERATVTVLERLGASDERVHTEPGPHDRLAVIALDCGPGRVLPRVPGLPEDVFEHDGQITKRQLRALALAALAPVPGQLLWDVGAGSGSVGIEWMRVHPACRAVAVEPRPDRAQRIARNAASLGVPGLEVIQGSAPDALAGLAAPDAVFLGGGVSVPGVLETCTAALAPGGRLVAHGVTLETNGVLAQWHARLGGSLTRVALERAEALGTFTGWTPSRAVVQWSWLR